MKRFIATLLLSVLVLTSIASAYGWVSGYMRHDGTYVQPYTRSGPSDAYDKNGNWKGW